MGYFKRKQTKKKGKRGTKKYRGGMNAKAAAKGELTNKFNDLKLSFEELMTDPIPVNFTKVEELMNGVSTAFSTYRKSFPEAGADPSIAAGEVAAPSTSSM